MEELLHPGDFLWGCFIQVVLFPHYLPTGSNEGKKKVTNTV